MSDIRTKEDFRAAGLRMMAQAGAGKSDVQTAAFIFGFLAGALIAGLDYHDLPAEADLQKECCGGAGRTMADQPCAACGDQHDKSA